MTRATPEGRVKARVRAVLARFPNLYQYWPVPTGLGASGLDCYIGYCGRMVVVETKAPGKQPTPRQELCLRELRAAGVRVFVIDGTDDTDSLESLEAHLLRIGDYAAVDGIVATNGAPHGAEAVPPRREAARRRHPA